MSSHHIVKDDQEPALIIANGESCSNELLGQLLEWSPYVIVLDNAIHRVLPMNFKVDVLLGDFDQGHDFETIKKVQYPIEIHHIPDQNSTDLEKAFEFLIQKGHRAVNVVWATGRRADHSITNMTSIVKYCNQLKIVLWDDYSKIFVLPKTFEKWYPKNTKLSLIPVGEVEGITSENLFYPLKNDTLRLGYKTGSSNHATEDGIVRISYDKGDLLLMECWDL